MTVMLLEGRRTGPLIGWDREGRRPQERERYTYEGRKEEGEAMYEGKDTKGEEREILVTE